MRTSQQILPGVKKIYWLDGEKLSRRVDIEGICCNPIPILTDIHEVYFFDEPECKCKTVVEGRTSTDTATLTFRCGDLLPIHKRLGFVVIDTNDKCWLIGSKEPPYPKLEIEMGVGDCDTDGAGYECTVTHVALKTMIECMI